MTGLQTCALPILRTNVETSDTQGVLDGDLDQFMAAALALDVSGKDRQSGE